MPRLIVLLLALSLGACTGSNGAIDMAGLRRASVASLESGTGGEQMEMARREAMLGIRRVVRDYHSGDSAIEPDDLTAYVTPENLAGSGDLDTLDLRRGALDGPSESFHALAPLGTARFQIAFRGHQSALVMVTSLEAPLELKLLDKATGKTRCVDTVRRGVALCRLRPQANTVYDVVVVNPNNRRIRFSLLNN